MSRPAGEANIVQVLTLLLTIAMTFAMGLGMWILTSVSGDVAELRRNHRSHLQYHLERGPTASIEAPVSRTAPRE
jgi:hypothetical protein